MKPGIPWSVKGIDEQARAAAKQAARQSGMTIGEWLNSIILDSAEEGDDLERRFRRGPYRPKTPPHGAEGEADDVNVRLEELADQLHALTSQQSDTAVSRLSAAAGSDQDQGVVQAILQRLDSYEQHTSSALGAMQQRLEEVSERLSRLPDAALPQSPADVPGLPALEGAMRNIIEHIEVSDTRTRDAVKALQDRFERMEAYDSAGPGAAVIARLEQSVAELSQRMAGSESGAEAHQHVHDDITKLRAEVESLNQRFDDLKSDAASDRDLHALRATVDGLAAAGRSDGTAGLERQIAGLAERLTVSEQRLDHMATIERSVEQLVKSLDETRASTAAVAHDAAKRAADQVLAERSSPDARSPELDALEEGLKAVRASAEVSDRRTQETFAAVHETLEQIVAKLAELETDDSQPETDNAHADATHADEADDAESDDAESEDTVSLHDTETPELDSLLADEDQASPAEDGDETENLDGDEPDSVAEPDLQATSYASQIEAPDEDQHEPESSEVPVREDYIAAARRAAQMASARNSGFNRFSQRVSGSSPQASATPGGKGEKKRRFGLSGLGRSRGAANGQAAGGSKRKRLILAGLVLLVAASAYGASRHAGLVSSTDALWPSVDFGQPPAPVSAAPEPQNDRQSDAQPLDPQSQRRSDAQALEPTATAAISAHAAAQTDVAPAAPEIGPDSLRQAAAKGDAAAQFIVASHYLDGDDPKQAVEWLKRAALQGHAPSQYRLGTLYERGRGVSADRDAARLWYEEAAGRGNIRAMHNLAVLHADPNNGQTNIELAADWFRKAAERGLTDSQFNLAVLSAQGAGVPQDGEEALFWFSLSAAQGDPEAAVRVRSLESSLPPEAVEQVKERLVGWKPLPADEAANAVKVADPSWHEASAADAGTKAAAAQPVSDPALSDSALVRKAQTLLSEQGFDIGDEDGVMGDRTANAVRLFQLQNRLPVNGMVSQDLVRALESRQL